MYILNGNNDIIIKNEFFASYSLDTTFNIGWNDQWETNYCKFLSYTCDMTQSI